MLIPPTHGPRLCHPDGYMEFLYKADNFYTPQADGGIRWNHPELNINWGVEELVLSAKDQCSPFLKVAVTVFEIKGDKI